MESFLAILCVLLVPILFNFRVSEVGAILVNRLGKIFRTRIDVKFCFKRSPP